MGIIDTETFPVMVDSVGYKDGKPTAYYGAIQKRLQKPEAARELTVEQLAEPSVRPPGGEHGGTYDGRQYRAELSGMSGRIDIMEKEQQDHKHLRVEFAGLGIVCHGTVEYCHEGTAAPVQRHRQNDKQYYEYKL